ncbi:hypothetical protein QYE76_003537 [Lolium multiflorum]|uniref:Uncharacterized protein n=1 Tax=Lolium multiflorum TaxID=4521 RepID=A0AAD8VZB9_LOLMU|nr:hypothetical protein QYE76_003537 [Lolium multiflorum]
MTSSSSATALAAALGAPPTQLLTRDNALIWNALVVPALRGACVLDLVEGEDKAPAKVLETEDSDGKKVTIPNPNYASWIARDQQVLRWLLNALSPDVLAHVIGLETSAEVWDALNTHVSASSKTRVQHLRTALVETKKNTMSAEKYFSKMKTIAQELAATGKPIDDDELVWYVLKNLDCTILKIQALPPPLTLLAVVVVLHRGAKTAGMMTVVAKTGGVMIAHAIVRMVAMEVVVTVVATKAVATVGIRIADIRIAAVMMIAHVAVMMEIGVMMVHAVVIASLLDCWWRYEEDRDRRDNGDRGRKDANFASHGVDTNWYYDTGATDHITGELNKLSTHDDYNGRDQVRTAEGTGLLERDIFDLFLPEFDKPWKMTLSMRQKKTKIALKSMQILLQISPIPRDLSPRLILPPSGRAEMHRPRLPDTRLRPVLVLHMSGGPRPFLLRVLATRLRPALARHLAPRLPHPLLLHNLLLILSPLDRLRRATVRVILWLLHKSMTSPHHHLRLLRVFVLACSKV